MAVHSGYLIAKIFQEAGLPNGVIQFLPTLDAPSMCKTVFAHRELASLHFTGSTHVFKQLWKEIGNNVDKYRSYPRIVGETGGKNFHLVHKSADVRMAVVESVRAAFEYQGQLTHLDSPRKLLIHLRRPEVQRFVPTLRAPIALEQLIQARTSRRGQQDHRRASH